MSDQDEVTKTTCVSCGGRCHVAHMHADGRYSVRLCPYCKGCGMMTFAEVFAYRRDVRQGRTLTPRPGTY